MSRLLQELSRAWCSLVHGSETAQAWGFFAVMTYTLASESGASLRGAGWWPEAVKDSGSWTRPSRERFGAKVSSVDVGVIRSTPRDVTNLTLAVRFGVHAATISRIRRGETRLRA